ncbi:putative nicotinate phosphoribosyltransferase [Dioscorea sansibarensis]
MLILMFANVATGKLFGIPLRGTHSHAFVSAFMITNKSLCSQDGSRTCEDFVGLVQSWLRHVLYQLVLVDSLSGFFGETNQSDLAAFISYALPLPCNFLALVDTYDVSLFL